jgi:hypothetical protein
MIYIALLISGYFNYAQYVEYNCIEVERTVIDIGGCNYSGRCAVRYDNGEIGNLVRPIMGQEVEVIVCP